MIRQTVGLKTKWVFNIISIQQWGSLQESVDSVVYFLMWWICLQMFFCSCSCTQGIKDKWFFNTASEHSYVVLVIINWSGNGYCHNMRWHYMLTVSSHSYSYNTINRLASQMLARGQEENLVNHLVVHQTATTAAEQPLEQLCLEASGICNNPQHHMMDWQLNFFIVEKQKIMPDLKSLPGFCGRQRKHWEAVLFSVATWIYFEH